MRKILTVEQGLEYLRNDRFPLYKIENSDFVKITEKELLAFTDFDRTFTQLISENIGGEKWDKTFTDEQVEYASVIGKLEIKIENLERNSARLEEDEIRAENNNQELMEVLELIGKDIQKDIPDDIRESFYNDYLEFINKEEESYQMYVHSFEVFEKDKSLHTTVAKESRKGHFITHVVEKDNYYAQWSYGD